MLSVVEDQYIIYMPSLWPSDKYVILECMWPGGLVDTVGLSLFWRRISEFVSLCPEQSRMTHALLFLLSTKWNYVLEFRILFEGVFFRGNRVFRKRFNLLWTFKAIGQYMSWKGQKYLRILWSWTIFNPVYYIPYFWQ